MGVLAFCSPSEGLGQTLPLSFDAAVERLERVAPAVVAADHSVNAARLTEQSLASLNRPIVTVSVQYVEYEKTLSIDLAGPRREVLEDTRAYLDAIPGTVVPPFQAIATDVVGRISQALPTLFSPIPEELSYQFRSDAFRPTVQGVVPLYSGGAIPAIKRGARAGTELSEARAQAARDLAYIDLISAYFGQLAAESLEASALASRDALDSVLSDATKLESAGVIPRARQLEAQVARDAAQRVYQRAVLAHASARTDLASLLEVESVRPASDLFVDSSPLPPAASFLGGEGQLPQAQEADALGAVASAGTDLAKSRLRPQAFAFGEYNLSPSTALPVEPDWIVGVGIRYTLFSNIGRSQAAAAAREQQFAAEEAARGVREAARSATLRAWDLTESARQSFVLLGSSIAAATENLRVQRISFREGEGTVTEVLGAEAALAAARTQRITAAYEYDLALAALLASSGRLSTFPDYLAKADVRLAPAVSP